MRLGPVAEDSLSWLDLSPDGRRAAVYRSVAGNGNIWLIDALRTARFTFGGQGIQENLPLWSPDGSRISYMKSSRGARLGEYVRSSSGAASEQPLSQDPTLIGMTSWSRDERFILVDRDPVDIWVIRTDLKAAPAAVYKRRSVAVTIPLWLADSFLDTITPTKPTS